MCEWVAVSCLCYPLKTLSPSNRAISTVRRLIDTNSPVHATLFFGSAGSNKDQAANLLAQAWLCTSVSSKPCSECISCKPKNGGQSVDLLTISPQGPSNNIRVSAIGPVEPPEPVLSLQEFFRTPPLMATHKVAVIWDAHRLNRDAANRLLKSLEEPLPYCKLILVTSQPSSLLATILSRCLTIRCEAPSPSGDTEHDRLLFLAEGVLENVDRYTTTGPEREIIDFAGTLLRATPAGALHNSAILKQMIDDLAKKSNLNQRAAASEALRLLSRATIHERPHWGQAIAECHRRITGNASTAYALDAMFVQLLAH